MSKPPFAASVTFKTMTILADRESVLEAVSQSCFCLELDLSCEAVRSFSGIRPSCQSFGSWSTSDIASGGGCLGRPRSMGRGDLGRAAGLAESEGK